MDEGRSENLPSWDADADVDPRDDAGEEIEARIEQADGAYASDGFGTTAYEEEVGESLDQRLAEERPDRRSDDVGVAIEDAAAPDEEGQLVGDASVQRDSLVAPEEAAMRISPSAPGGTDGEPEAGDPGS